MATTKAESILTTQELSRMEQLRLFEILWNAPKREHDMLTKDFLEKVQYERQLR